MRCRFLLSLAVTFCVICPAFSQKQSPADRVIQVRALYYTPTTSGLTSFGCRVSVDWKDFLSKASGKEIADDNPLLTYLKSVQMSVNDNLRGSGQLEWANTSVPVAGLQDSVAKMSDGLKQMFDGFFQSWNAYLNGSMVPAPDKQTTVTVVDDGIHLRSVASKVVVEEEFDKNMLLTKAHVINETLDVAAIPVFIDTPDGRVISEVHDEVRQPPTAPPMLVNMFVTYQQVAGYRLPDAITYDVRNVIRIQFKLTDCSVNSKTFQPTK